MEAVLSVFCFVANILSFRLFFYLLHAKFEVKRPSKIRIPAAVTALLVILSAMNLAGVESNVFLVVLYAVLLYGYALLFLKGAKLQMLFWVIADVVCVVTGYVIADIYLMLVYGPVAPGTFLSAWEMLQLNMVALMAQGAATYILARKRSDPVKMSPLTMLILILIPSLSCLILAVLTQYSIINDSAAALLVFASVTIMAINVAVFGLYENMTRLTRRYLEQQTQLQRASLEKVHYGEIKSLYEETRKWRHDYRNHLQAIDSYVQSGNEAGLRSYLAGIGETVEKIDFRVNSGNELLDAIVNVKISRAQALGIHFEAEVIPVPNHMDPLDITALIGNLLDNAIEACMRIEDSAAEKFVILKIFDVKGQLGILVRNSAGGRIQRDQKRFFTSKSNPERHGIGIGQIDTIVERYGGTIERTVNEGEFETVICLGDKV